MKDKSHTPFQKILLSLVAPALASFLIGCQPPEPTPQEACNFVQNSAKQRVSWAGRVLKFDIHESVPIDQYVVIREAASIWNEALGRTVIVIELEGVSGNISDRRDGVSTIYRLDKWDNDNHREQARTTIRWKGDDIYEADILLNDDYFEFAPFSESIRYNQVDLLSLLVHEMGHALGLAHIDQEESVMATYLPKGVRGVRQKIAAVDVESLKCEY